MTDVFISYSRRDTEFVRRLFDALKLSGRDAWVDWQGIDYSTKWWEEICAGIESADNFVLIVSPDALNSVYCHREIEHARLHHKRIIPFIYRPLDEAALVGGWYTQLDMRPHESLARANWEAVKTIQWIDYPGKLAADFERALAALIATVDTDPERVRLHTRLLLRLRDWEARGRSPSALLRGDELVAYEDWLRATDTAGDEPRATDDQRAYITESRRIEDDNIRKARQQRRLTWSLVIASAVLAIFLVAAFFVGLEATMQSRVANTQVAIATHAQGQAIVAQNTSVAEANAAATEVAKAGQTLTPIPSTLTAVAEEVELGKTRYESLRLAALASDELISEPSDPSTSTLLGIRALNIAYTAQAESILVRASRQNDELDARRLVGHTEWVNSAVYSPDGRFIVSASQDNTAIIWNAFSGQSLRTLVGHTENVESAAFNPDGRFIVTASWDNTAIIWDANTGEQILTLSGHNDDLQSAVYSPDGRFIDTASWDGIAIIWDASTGDILQKLDEHSSRMYSADYSPDGNFIVTGYGDGTAIIWNVNRGEEVKYLGHEGSVQSASYSPDGRFIVTATYDGEVIVWDVASGEILRSLVGHTEPLESAAFSPDGRYIVTAGNDGTIIWDANSGEILRMLGGNTSYVNSAAYSPDGRFIVTAFSFGEKLIIWTSSRSEVLRTLPGYYSAIYSPDGRFIVTARDDTAIIWNISSGETLRTLSGYSSPVDSLAYSLDARFIATGHRDGTAIIWDASSGAMLRTIAGHTHSITSLTFSPDGNFIVTATGSVQQKGEFIAIVWDAIMGEILHRLANHTRAVTSVSFSPDGQFILTASWDGTAIIWDAITGEPLTTFGDGDVNRASYSPDGHFIVTGSGSPLGDSGTVKIWNADSKELIRTLIGNTSYVNSAVFSPDGRFIIVASADTAIVWNAFSGESVRTLPGNNSGILDAIFSPLGNFIATTDYDGTVIIWDADYRVFVMGLCERLRFMSDIVDFSRDNFGLDDTPTCPQFATPTP